MIRFLLATTLLLVGAPGERIVIPAGMATVGADRSEIVAALEGTGARPAWYADESPRQTIVLPSFAIDQAEVTNERYREANPDHLFPPNLANHPVVNVTFAAAGLFCASVGGRLPTEAEWERAARGDEGRIYPWGDRFIRDGAVYAEEEQGGSRLKVGAYALEQSSSQTLGGTRPVGSVPKGTSPFGLVDMAGNAWEWVDGFYDEQRGLRLLKGGSWLTPAASLRASTRLGDPGVKRYNDFGFRCAYDAP